MIMEDNNNNSNLTSSSNSNSITYNSNINNINVNNNNNDMIVLWAILAMTFQWIRVFIAMIQAASRRQEDDKDDDDDEEEEADKKKKKDDDDNNKNSNNNDEEIKKKKGDDNNNSNVMATPTTTPTTTNETSSFLQQQHKAGQLYGSVDQQPLGDNNENDEEQQPLLVPNNNNHPNNNSNRMNPMIFLVVVIHIGLILYFAMEVLVLWTVKSNSTSTMVVFPYSPPFYILASIILIMNLGSCFKWQKRTIITTNITLGWPSRIFSFLTATTIWFTTMWYGWNHGKLWMMMYRGYDDHNNNNNSNHMLAIHVIGTMLAMTIYFIMNWIHIRYAPFPSELDDLQQQKLQHKKKNKTNKPTLSRLAIFTLLRPYFWPDATSSSATFNRFRAIFTWVCVLLSKLSNVISPILLGNASTALAHGQYTSCIYHAIGYCTVTFFGTVFKEGQSLVYLKVAQAAFVQLCETTFWHLHTLSLDWHLKKKLGEVIRSMDRGIGACDTLMRYLFLWLVPAMLECLVVCIIFAFYFAYWPLAISVFYYVMIYIVWTILVTVWRKKFRKAVVQSDNEWHDLCTDSLINFETVKTFTAERYEQERFGNAVRNYQAGSVHVQASLSFLNITQTLLLQACLATSLSLTAMAIQERITCCTTMGGCDSGISDCCQQSIMCHKGMQVGDFVAVLSYTLQLFTPLNFLGSVYNAIVMAMIDLTSLSELLAESPDVTDATHAIPIPTKNNTNDNDDVAVEFDNVFFHYPTQPKTKGLKGVSFVMKRGTTTAIVGPTGSGKTTISRLFFRFYDVLGGAVKINGVDVRNIAQTSLRGAIGVVPQQASMFNDTIRANLLYGRRDATQAELEQAARDSQILDFIESLDDGWDTMVGDRGLKLSGGEKQRAAIARCLLKDPPFVLLDEATSALDTITEASVQEALDRLGSERTVLVIAHRLGTIRNADNIIVLKDGQVHEQGTHDELMAKGGMYAEMWNMQLHAASASTSMVGLNVASQE